MPQSIALVYGVRRADIDKNLADFLFNGVGANDQWRMETAPGGPGPTSGKNDQWRMEGLTNSNPRLEVGAFPGECLAYPVAVGPACYPGETRIEHVVDTFAVEHSFLNEVKLARQRWYELTAWVSEESRRAERKGSAWLGQPRFLLVQVERP